MSRPLHGTTRSSPATNDKGQDTHQTPVGFLRSTPGNRCSADDLITGFAYRAKTPGAVMVDPAALPVYALEKREEMPMRTLLMLALFMLAACDNSQERLASLKKTFPTNSTCSMNPKISQVVINGVTQE